MNIPPELKSEIEKSNFLNAREVKKLPERPGIYIYLGSDKNPLYVGKSVSLKKRVMSYLTLPLEPKTAQLISEAKYFTTILVNSELEALLLEAKLIKIFRPKYNIELKDDKHPLYIQITREKYPRVILSRKADLLRQEYKKDRFYGPFPSSSNVKYVLKVVRRIFPFASHKPEKRPCIYSQIGLCRPCPSYIEKTQDDETKDGLIKIYRRNIRIIKIFLNGNIEKVKGNVLKQMKEAAVAENFEEAQFLKRKLERIEYVTSSYISPTEFMANPNLMVDIREKEMSEVVAILKSFYTVSTLSRVECFDIAHIGGTKPTASMVTFKRGESDKNMYRRFKINQKKGNNDIASLAEVANRREKHLADWGTPDLIIVDGGKAQTGVFRDVFFKHKIPVVGLAKRFETVIVPTGDKDFKEIRLKKGPAKNFFQRIRDEAHRFARSYHHKLIKKELLK